MKIQISLEPLLGIMNAIASLDINEVESKSFYLNRDFEITRLILDNTLFDANSIKELIKINDSFNYEVVKYTLPANTRDIRIEYKGKLTGETGCCPYVKETISEEFSLLRWETYCYPLFIPEKERGLYEYLSEKERTDDIAIVIPSDYTAISSARETKKITTDNKTEYRFIGSAKNFSVAIGKYKKLVLSCGDFFMLGDEINIEMIEDSLANAYEYMNNRFGQRDISSELKYIVIKDGMGQYVQNNTVFIVESSLNQKSDLSTIIHEFIHLGWNPKVNVEIQRSRFFDEAITNYFTLRVMEKLLKRKEYLIELNRYIESFNWCKNRLDKQIPISKFGEYGYGDLSYSIGALFFKELEVIIGRDIFDDITREFLIEYQSKNVNFELFKEFYMNRANNDEIEGLFNDWIYSTSGYNKYLL